MTLELRRAVILTHVEREGPGLIAELCRARGWSVEILPLHAGAEVPPEPPAAGLLVVMGGPMGVADVGSREFPFLRTELELLRRAVERDHPTLGVCLGSQLLAHAAGARVFPNPGGREVGFGRVRLERAVEPELLADLPEELLVLHWHGDTFELPASARGWASSERCKNQAFCLKRRLIGLQFHAEASPEMVDQWLAADRAYVLEALGADGDLRVAEEARELGPAHAALGRRLLGAVLERLVR